jgi:hypothetical protein
MGEARAKTAEELQDDFMAQCRILVHYWDTVKDVPQRERLSGLLHSVLVMIDGQSGGWECALDLVCRPHPDDKAYHIDEGSNWIEDGTILNDTDLLHELLYQHGWM